MLEKNFNELDNDFITLWSMLFKEERPSYGGKFAEYIEYLAEMGQVNALQSYYIYNRKGKNKNVDLVANHYIKAKDDFNIDLLKSHSSCCMLKGLEDLIADTIEETQRFFRHKYDVDVDMSSKLARKDLSYRLQQKDYYIYLIRSIERAKTEWIKNGDVLAGERLIEMLASLMSVWPLSEDKPKMKQKVITYSRQIRKQLWTDFMAHKWSVDEIISKNPAIAYALGKNLTSSSLRRWYEIDTKREGLEKKLLKNYHPESYLKPY